MKQAITIKAILALVIAFVAFTQVDAAVKKGSTVAFIRNGDVWLMESDGSNQRPFVAGIANAVSRMSWSPDNKRLVFVRRGEINLKYPEGGGGAHKLYDLFYAYTDSTNNFWEGITETMGAQAPEFSRDGSRILFVHDKNANLVNAALPKYRLSFYDTKSYLLRDLDLEQSSDLLCTTPTMSPDMSKVAFLVMRVQGQQFTPTGIAVAAIAEFPIKDDVLLERARKLGNAMSPSWSPDGLWIAYVSSDMSNPGLYLAKPDLSEKKQLWAPPTGLELDTSTPSWSPDSKMLLFATVNGSIYKIPVTGGQPIRLSGPGADSKPAWCN
jgi:Tol biopolymer transport system component